MWSTRTGMMGQICRTNPKEETLGSSCDNILSRDQTRGAMIEFGEESSITMLCKSQMFRTTGGNSPPNHLNLEDWLRTSPPANIYVLGFQEIVPPNVGNVLGTEDNGPARKWVSLIRRTLGNIPGASYNGSYHTPSPVPDPVVELEADFEGSSTRHRNSSFFHRRSFQSPGCSIFS